MDEVYQAKDLNPPDAIGKILDCLGLPSRGSEAGAVTALRLETDLLIPSPRASPTRLPLHGLTASAAAGDYAIFRFSLLDLLETTT
jgi:hypothetical protein